MHLCLGCGLDTTEIQQEGLYEDRSTENDW